MAKQKTIACDSCGHRMDAILDNCPECGEVIKARMDPHVRSKLAAKMDRKKWVVPSTPFKITALVIYAVMLILYLTASIQIDMLYIILAPLILIVICVTIFDTSILKKKVLLLHLYQFAIHLILPFVIAVLDLEAFGGVVWR